MRCILKFSGVGLLLISLVGLTGCGGMTPESSVAESNKTNMQRLGNMYQMFQFKNQLRGPRDEAEFKEFIRGVNPKVLEPRGIDPNDLDSLFVSQRDKEPFAIRYNVPSGPRGSDEPVIFENTGNGGPRMVYFLNMIMREVEAEEYNNLLNSEPKKLSDY